MNFFPKILCSCVLITLTLFCYAQQTIEKTFIHNNIERTYILYVPATYSETISTPLVLNFHGYGSNANQQIIYGDFRAIADTAGFLVVHPQGTFNSEGDRFWNSGFGSSIDDLGFTAALIDSLSADYNINQNRIYSTGMSNGGYMSYFLACYLSDKIAAIASVTGSMVNDLANNCTPSHSIPVMQIHGTADPTVPYEGDGFGQGIEEVVDFWVAQNQCNPTPVFLEIPDINTTDGCTAEEYIYTNGTSGSEVIFYKILGGGHTWPGAFHVPIFGNTNQDIHASTLIWQFFAQYDLNGRIFATSTNDSPISKAFTIQFYPNPIKKTLHINFPEMTTATICLSNVSGQKINEISLQRTKHSTIDMQDLGIGQGIYLLQIYDAQKQLISVHKITKH